MGARQSKRSVDISSTPKKGDLENGTVTTTEEKLEKIGEGDSATTKVNANGSTTTTSTVTAEQQETAAAAATSPPEAGDAPVTKTEVAPQEAEKPADVSTTSVEEKEEPTSPASPSETTATEESNGTEKKKKPKKKWSFRSFSFSKKDKVKPPAKEEKQETVPEGNENTQSEQPNTEVTNAPAVQSEEPPPLPTSPPPTPADETAEKEETPTISEGDVDASGGGEGLAEPIEEGELEESTTAPVAAPEVASTPAAAPAAPVETAPLTNGVAEQNGDYKEQNGKFTENDELISPVHERKPSVDSVTAKIGSLKLQITSENAEPAQNGVADETAPVELNGLKESDVPTTEKAAAVVEN